MRAHLWKLSTAPGALQQRRFSQPWHHTALRSAAVAPLPRRVQPQRVRASHSGLQSSRQQHAHLDLGRRAASSTAEGRPTPEEISTLVLEHPDVAQCEVVHGAVYVVRAEGPDGRPVALSDWALEHWLSGKMGVPESLVPRVRFVDRLAWSSSCRGVPFKLNHILGALYEEMDADDGGNISLDEFLAFCRNTGLLQGGDFDAREVFLQARPKISTSDLLFRDDDFFQMQERQINTISFYEFQKLIMDSGIVEIDQDKHGARYFIEEKVVDVILRRWFAEYDVEGHGRMSFQSYERVVEEYGLPLAVSASAFRRLEADGPGSGIDLAGFQSLLEHAQMIAVGSTVDRSDTMGEAWRALQETQVFLPQRRVFVADGREGSSPPRTPGSVRFVCISDTHGLHQELTWRLPEGDVLLHAGDFSMSGGLDEVQDFARWLRSLPYRRKVVIAGNHDLSLDGDYTGNRSPGGEEVRQVRKAFLEACGTDVNYLEDQECEVDGIRIYGTPHQPEFGDWAFNVPRGQHLLEKWSAIPAGVQILLVHGPALGHGDLCVPSGHRAGCLDLLTDVQGRIKPEFLVCGHVHESAGVTFDGTTHFLNASSVNEEYEVVHPPLVFDVPIKA